MLAGSTEWHHNSHLKLLTMEQLLQSCLGVGREHQESSDKLISNNSQRHRYQNLAAQCEIPPPYRAIPFRDSIAEGGIAPICLVFIGYRASIAEIPLWGGDRTSTSHALQGGNAQRGRGYRTQVAMLIHQKPHSAQ